MAGYFKRKFRQLSFNQIATFTCVGLCILILFSTILEAISEKNLGYETSEIIINIISGAINVIFYFSLANMFSKYKNDFSVSYRGMSILVLCDFILPFILDLMRLIMNGGIASVPFYLVISIFSSGLGIAYFIFIFVENKKSNKRKVFNILMIVFGALLCASTLFSTIDTIIIVIDSFINVDFSSNIIGIISNILVMIISLFTFIESGLYVLYPLYLKRFRNEGF